MRTLTRREILATTAGMAGFTFLPARVLGRGGPTPSDKLNVAVIGIGCRGEISVSELNNAQQNLVALCDVDWRPLENYTHPRACEVIKRFPNAKRYDDWRIMLHEQDKNIDAVVVATPDHVHAIAALTAMKMGKHVYVEKPLAHNIYEVRTLMAAEKEYKVATQVGHQGHSSEDCCQIVGKTSLAAPPGSPFRPALVGYPPPAVALMMFRSNFICRTRISAITVTPCSCARVTERRRKQCQPSSALSAVPSIPPTRGAVPSSSIRSD